MSAPFRYYTTTPAANESPGGTSQALMLQNFQSINGIVGVDHVPFNNLTGGQHKQVTFNTTSAPSLPTGTTTIVYSGAATPLAGVTVPQLYMATANSRIPLSPVKAFGTFESSGGGNTTFLAGYNVPTAPNSVVTTATANNTYTYTFTLTANCANFNKPANIVIYNKGASGSTDYTINNSGVFAIVAPRAATTRISFTLMQI